MDRTPPLAVQRILRQEVGCGCPIRGCRKPFLTFHHFDPPWREKDHHDPNGMVALCSEHHHAADRGIYSKGKLKGLKRSAHSVEDVKALFPWEEREMLVRLGGCYVLGQTKILQLNGQSIISLARDPSGHLLISFRLRSEDGNTTS